MKEEVNIIFNEDIISNKLGIYYDDSVLLETNNTQYILVDPRSYAMAKSQEKKGVKVVQFESSIIDKIVEISGKYKTIGLSFGNNYKRILELIDKLKNSSIIDIKSILDDQILNKQENQIKQFKKDYKIINSIVDKINWQDFVSNNKRFHKNLDRHIIIEILSQLEKITNSINIDLNYSKINIFRINKGIIINLNLLFKNNIYFKYSKNILINIENNKLEKFNKIHQSIFEFITTLSDYNYISSDIFLGDFLNNKVKLYSEKFIDIDFRINFMLFDHSFLEEFDILKLKNCFKNTIFSIEIKFKYFSKEMSISYPLEFKNNKLYILEKNLEEKLKSVKVNIDDNYIYKTIKKTKRNNYLKLFKLLNNATTLLIFNKGNIKYLTGVDSAKSLKILNNKDKNNNDNQKNDKENYTCEFIKNQFINLDDLSNKNTYYDENISYSNFQNIKNKSNDLTEKIREIRILKDDFEIKNIKKACNVAEYVLDKVILKLDKWIRNREKISEQRIKNEILKEAFLLTGEDVSFDTIVAFGKNTAVPHWKSSAESILNNDGDVILIDYGCSWNQYKSDTTRNIIIGKYKYLSEYKKAYKDLLSVQRKCIKKAKLNINARELNRYQLVLLEKLGYGKNIRHSLGHGVGVDIHEAPFLNSRSIDIIDIPKDNNKNNSIVFTIEPGIYNEKFGIRIEDMVCITKSREGKIIKSNLTKKIANTNYYLIEDIIKDINLKNS